MSLYFEVAKKHPSFSDKINSRKKIGKNMKLDRCDKVTALNMVKNFFIYLVQWEIKLLLQMSKIFPLQCNDVTYNLTSILM